MIALVEVKGGRQVGQLPISWVGEKLKAIEIMTVVMRKMAEEGNNTKLNNAFCFQRCCRFCCSVLI